MSQDLAPLRSFVQDFARLLDRHPLEPRIVAEGSALLRRLVARDDWLPEPFATPDPQRYCQYLLHADPAGRFSVVSFVWGPAQSTPVHDHTVWGLIGVLRGAEFNQRFVERDGRLRLHGAPMRLDAGEVEAVSPMLGDVHRVHNALDDRVSISIHVYGADIGKVRRHTYPPEGGRQAFVSGYANPGAPLLRTRSEPPRPNARP
jgi:predicted metal-dependent enzyme (double-stranded beta helix superfamily)